MSAHVRPCIVCLYCNKVVKKYPLRTFTMIKDQAIVVLQFMTELEPDLHFTCVKCNKQFQLDFEVYLMIKRTLKKKRSL